MPLKFDGETGMAQHFPQIGSIYEDPHAGYTPRRRIRVERVIKNSDQEVVGVLARSVLIRNDGEYLHDKNKPRSRQTEISMATLERFTWVTVVHD